MTKRKEPLNITIGRYLYWNKITEEQSGPVMKVIAESQKLEGDEFDLLCSLVGVKRINAAAVKNQGTELIVVDKNGEFGVSKDRFEYIDQLANTIMGFDEVRAKLFDFMLKTLSA
jgi:hypothetical protein